MQTAFQGLLTEKEQFLFPDSPLGMLPDRLSLVCARNGKPGVQLLLKVQCESVRFQLHGDGFRAEWYQMLPIPVEYNTGDGSEQGGAMVLLKDSKPDYAIRKAPFFVYDCLKPAPDGLISVADGHCALYFCLVPSDAILPGLHTLALEAQTGQGVYRCSIDVRVYDTLIPEESFGVTNWFSFSAICRQHGVEPGSEAFLTALDSYIRLMRRMRQNMFYLSLDQTCVRQRDPYAFDFEYLQPIISRFFSGGMKRLEIGPLLSRGVREDGMPDMYTDDFKCAMAPHISLETPEGYAITAAFSQALAAFLQKYGWADRVVFHIHDEPDVHYRDEACLNARRRQYYMAGAILKKYLPRAQIIEAVKGTAFRGGVDIWVPLTASYEEEKQAFDALRDAGDEVWTYVCCAPEGRWLNRFLDQAVIHSRLLFWGFEKNGMSGYLHWGLNQFPEGMNPFEATSCHNPTGLGTNFPCGDAFIVYPGTDGAWPSMRLEAERRGTEDLELLRALKQLDPLMHERLIAAVFQSNAVYTDDEAAFQRVYEQLLESLERLSHGE